VPIQLDQVRLERSRSFGEVYLGWTLWRGLELDRVVGELLPPGREAVPWGAMAALLVIARLCEPASELAIAERWYQSTALEDILGVAVATVNDDRLYRALDPATPTRWAPSSESNQGMAPAQAREPAEAAVGGDPLAS
jgi:hypothetical protein